MAPEDEGEEESDVGDVVAVVAADDLEAGDGQRAEEVAQADRADHLGHALVTRGQLTPHVVAAFYSKIRLMVHRIMVQSAYWFMAGPDRNRGLFGRQISPRVPQ